MRTTPNVLLILSDMIGAKHFGCYGDPASVTPNVDRLARSGAQFGQAYCACPPCIPARVSLMSGQYAHTHGKMAHVKMEVEPRPKLLPEILTENGYRTAMVGKTHWWPPSDDLGCERADITIDTHLTPELGRNDAWIRHLEERGIFTYNPDTWKDDIKKIGDASKLPSDCVKVHWTGDRACEIMRDYATGEKPFFLMCSFVEPHGWGCLTPELWEKFADVPVPPPVGGDETEIDKPESQRNAVAAWKDFTGGPFGDVMKYRRGVYASLSLVDAEIGKLMECLDELGIRDNTVILFTTDHGDLMYDHGCIEKGYLYDAAVRLPFLISGPGVPEGTERDHLVSQVDLLPTVLDFCGIDDGELKIEGRSVRPVIDDVAAPWRDTVYCEIHQKWLLKEQVQSSMVKMLRRGPWKYIYTLVDGHIVEEELYHLEEDPDELINLAVRSEHTELLKEFRDELLRWYVATEVNRLHPVPENHYAVPQVDRRWM